MTHQQPTATRTQLQRLEALEVEVARLRDEVARLSKARQPRSQRPDVTQPANGDSQGDRSQVAKIAANERWAKEPDRAAATAPARAGLQARFEREVDPEGVLPPGERAKRADSARRAHFQRLALKSAQARRAKRAGGGLG